MGARLVMLLCRRRPVDGRVGRLDQTTGRDGKPGLRCRAAWEETPQGLAGIPTFPCFRRGFVSEPWRQAGAPPIP